MMSLSVFIGRMGTTPATLQIMGGVHTVAVASPTKRLAYRPHGKMPAVTAASAGGQSLPYSHPTGRNVNRESKMLRDAS